MSSLKLRRPGRINEKQIQGRFKDKYKVEPIANNPQAPNPESPQELEQAGQVSLSADQTIQTQETSEPANDTNEQIIENLRDQRDRLRGISTLEAGEKPKSHKIKTLLLILLAVFLLSATYKLLLEPRLNKSTEITQETQKTFALPSDIKSKTSEEQNALNIIALARKNDADAIVNTYVNKAHLGQSVADFKALVASYSTSANGESAELIEKKVGKVDFADAGESSVIIETTAEFEAASLIYRSKYYNHTNNIYLKINLYKPDPTADVWKMYIFEFKAGEEQSPLKAAIEVPI